MNSSHSCPPSSLAPWPIRAALPIAFIMSLTTVAEPASNLMLRCATEKIIITEGKGQSSTTRETTTLTLRLDEARKTLKFADNTPLAIKRFDLSRITAEHGDIIYDFDRRNQTVSYAGSMANGALITTIVGSGSCLVSPTGNNNGGEQN